jgi:hypothetical protein
MATLLSDVVLCHARAEVRSASAAARSLERNQSTYSMACQTDTLKVNSRIASALEMRVLCAIVLHVQGLDEAHHEAPFHKPLETTLRCLVELLR